MNNIYTLFEKLIRSINLYGSAQIGAVNIPTGAYFEQNSLLCKFDSIIQKNLLVNEFSSAKILTPNDRFETLSVNVAEYLTHETRLECFILIYNKLFNIHTNDVVSSFKPILKKLVKVFSIDKNTFESIETFYKNQYFNDIHDSFYIVSSRFNRLSAANGAKVNYSGANNKIVYLKLLSNFNILLAKNITTIKRYDQFTEELEISGINFADKASFSEFVKCDLSYKELIKAISKPISTNSIEIKQNESFPYINLDPINGIIVIEGVSTPISPLTYLEPILDWIDLYCSNNNHLEINLTFHYYNTYTTKFLVRLMDKCNTLNSNGSSVIINWNYSQNDEEIKECGEFYKELFFNKPEFQLVSVI